ncbi:hypothetical protein HK101_007346 [Irineochytrium annulatum]|nr:hypothetical protein HK101_007346 [Irineochytrium annulatum]
MVVLLGVGRKSRRDEPEVIDTPDGRRRKHWYFHHHLPPHPPLLHRDDKKKFQRDLMQEGFLTLWTSPAGPPPGFRDPRAASDRRHIRDLTFLLSECRAEVRAGKVTHVSSCTMTDPPEVASKGLSTSEEDANDRARARRRAALEEEDEERRRKAGDEDTLVDEDRSGWWWEHAFDSDSDDDDNALSLARPPNNSPVPGAGSSERVPAVVWVSKPMYVRSGKADRENWVKNGLSDEPNYGPMVKPRMGWYGRQVTQERIVGLREREEMLGLIRKGREGQYLDGWECEVERGCMRRCGLPA